jgi:hypothetical protein
MQCTIAFASRNPRLVWCIQTEHFKHQREKFRPFEAGIAEGFRSASRRPQGGTSDAHFEDKLPVNELEAEQNTSRAKLKIIPITE